LGLAFAVFIHVTAESDTLFWSPQRKHFHQQSNMLAVVEL